MKPALRAPKRRAVHHRHHRVQENEFWEWLLLLQMVERRQAMGNTHGGIAVEELPSAHLRKAAQDKK